MAIYTVKAHFDEEARVWYVSDSDVPGLATEANTPDELLVKLRVLIPELLECNGEMEDSAGIDEVPIELITYQSAMVSLAVA